MHALADMALRLPLTMTDDAGDSDVSRIFADHAEFVWRTLQRLGVRDVDIEDLLQEVFVVVHRRLSTFDGSAKMTSWLFAIALRVAQSHRRRAYFRRERTVAEVPEYATDGGSPEDHASVAQGRTRLREVLDALPLAERAVFVMFEIEELPCDRIAEMVGIPVGTVYSRLHAARASFQKALTRLDERDAARAARARRGSP